MSKMAKLEKVLTENPALGYRDMRDLLIEHGADGFTASEMAAGR